MGDAERGHRSGRASAETKVGGTRVEAEAGGARVEPPATVPGRKPKANSREEPVDGGEDPGGTEKLTGPDNIEGPGGLK